MGVGITIILAPVFYNEESDFYVNNPNVYGGGVARAKLVVKTGTLIIEGDLTGDLAVNGNLIVTGTITGNVTATGSITYGSLNGTAKPNAALYEYDFETNGQTVTISANLTMVDGVLSTTDNIDISAGSELTINCDFSVNTESSTDITIENGGTLIIGKDSTTTLTCTDTNEAGHGLWNYGDMHVYGTLIVDTSEATYIPPSTNVGSQAVRCSSGTLTIEQGGSIIAKGYGRGTSNNGTSTFIVYGTYISEGTGPNSCGIYNNDTAQFIVKDGGVVTCISEQYDGIHTSSIFTIENGGLVETTAARYGTYNCDDSADFTVSGKLVSTATGSSGIGIENYSSTAKFTVTSTGVVEASGASYGILNTGVFTVEDGGVVNTEGDISGLSNVNVSEIEEPEMEPLNLNNEDDEDVDDGVLTVDGTIYAYNKSESDSAVYSENDIEGVGKIYANDKLYYDDGLV